MGLFDAVIPILDTLGVLADLRLVLLLGVGEVCLFFFELVPRQRGIFGGSLVRQDEVLLVFVELCPNSIKPLTILLDTLAMLIDMRLIQLSVGGEVCPLFLELGPRQRGIVVGSLLR